jgi:hypothetical protein
MSQFKSLPASVAIAGINEIAQRNISPKRIMLESGTAIKFVSKK